MDPLKATAMASGTYLIYKMLDTPEITQTYTDIQLAGSPVLFALKQIGVFDPFKTAGEIIPFGPAEKLALSVLGAYVIVEHGVDMVGAVGKAATASAGMGYP